MKKKMIKTKIQSVFRRARGNALKIFGHKSAMALIVSVGVLGHLNQTTVKAQVLQGNNRVPSASTAINSNTPGAAPFRTSYADVVDKVNPAVVTVRSERKAAAQSQQLPFFDDPMFREFFGRNLPQMNQTPRVERGLGSGVIVESNGIILTNYHVLNGATEVKVDLFDKRTLNAKVLGTDEPSDLAVLKIEAENLPTVPLGNSDQVRVGDIVLAIGNPLGLRQTVTSGIISAKGRQTGLSDGSFEDFLQTDAPINQGNSGGALVNLNGELIGINSQILSPSGGSIGLGFAIPSNMAKSVMTQLIRKGRVQRGMIGVGIQDVTANLAKSFNLSDIRGVIISSIAPASPAEKAGLKQGDVILSFNGADINNGNELRNRVAQTAPGTEVSIGISRDGTRQTLKVKLGELESVTAAAEKRAVDAKPEDAQAKLGLTLEPLSPQTVQRFNLKNAPKNGLIVTNVQPGSSADDAGIIQGDVLLQINRQNVSNFSEVKQALEKSGNSVLLLINRRGQNLFVSLDM